MSVVRYWFIFNLFNGSLGCANEKFSRAGEQAIKVNAVLVACGQAAAAAAAARDPPTCTVMHVLALSPISWANVFITGETQSMLAFVRNDI